MTPMKQLILWGILIWLIGVLLIVLIPQSFADRFSILYILIFGLNIFGSLYVATGLIFSIPYIQRNFTSKTTKPRRANKGKR